MEIDHIDRNPFNQRWYNLREVTRRQNMQNTKRSRGGAIQGKRSWSATIQVGGVTHRFGPFNSEAEARAAYLSACASHGLAYLPELVTSIKGSP